MTNLQNWDGDIIDCHIHPFSSPETRLCPHGQPNCAKELFSELKRAGITRCCGTMIRRMENPEWADIRGLNDEAVALSRLYPEYIPGINVHPAYPDESCRELERLNKEENLYWVGELVAYMMNHRYSDPGMKFVFEQAQYLGMTVNFHDNNDLEEIASFCNDFPRLQLVMAHPRDGADYLARCELMKKYPNLHLDLSGTGLFRWGMLRHGIDIAGAEHFLFGTDFPICNPGMYVAGVKFEPLTIDEQRMIFADNFKRLAVITP